MSHEHQEVQASSEDGKETVVLFTGDMLPRGCGTELFDAEGICVLMDGCNRVKVKLQSGPQNSIVTHEHS